MSTPTEKIIEQLKSATDFQVNKSILKEKIKTELHLPFNGGLFYLTPSLMAFVSTWDEDTLFLEDSYNNPILISKAEFLVSAKEKYSSVMNSWHQQYEELKRIRKV